MSEVLELSAGSKNGVAETNSYVIKGGKSQITLSSGVTVQIRSVPMQVFMDINEELKPSEPQPPLESVPGAEDPSMKIPNYQDEGYKIAYQAWQYKIGVASTEAAFRLGVTVRLTEEDLQEVKQIRAYYARYRKTQLDEDDAYVYIKYVACVSEQDQVDLLNAVTRRSQPTEGAVASVIEQFPPVG